MPSYSLAHLGDHALLHGLSSLAAQDRATTSELLAHLAEVEARKLYLPAACPSMLDYCVRELRMSEDVALKRIRAARAARDFPAIFEAVADGRLNLTAVVRLGPHLTEDNAGQLLAAAAHKTKAEIDQMVARLAPRRDLSTRLEAIPQQITLVERNGSNHDGNCARLVPEPVEAATSPPKLAPLSPQRFGLQITIGQDTHDKLRYLQALLGHSVPTGDLAQVIDRAFDALIRELEKQKFAATSRPRPRRQPSANDRYIPADVKRRVLERDRGQCAFVSDSGQRCSARTALEFDHIQPVARGGAATVDGLRLLCRKHNQYEAERVFGAGFMEAKRAAARRAKAGRTQESISEHAKDVMVALRNLGSPVDRARRAAEYTETLPSRATLEDRIRAALAYLCPKRGGAILTARADEEPSSLVPPADFRPQPQGMIQRCDT